jgi:hypothetical protein
MIFGSHVDLALPALSLTRIDAFARSHGLTHAALFVEAVNRWAMQEAAPRDRRGIDAGCYHAVRSHQPA